MVSCYISRSCIWNAFSGYAIYHTINVGVSMKKFLDIIDLLWTFAVIAFSILFFVALIMLTLAGTLLVLIGVPLFLLTHFGVLS